MATDECCYVCNECPNSFTTLDELEHHIEAKHSTAYRTDTNTDESKTKETDEKMNVDDSKDDTTTIEHDGRDEGSGGNSPSSSDVSNFDGTMDSMNYGIDDTATSEETKNFSCRFCPKVFDDRAQLNVHYTHTHRDKPQYQCDECHTMFAVKRELRTHMRIHSGEQPHTCTQCGKQFGTRQLLKKHWMWHTGERSHVCPHCGKAFFQKGHLTQHLMIHAGGRPHQCQMCQKTFIFKFDLNRHMKIHAERGFSCEKCGRSFLKQIQLDEHMPKCKGSIANRSQSTTRTNTPMTEIIKMDPQSPRRQSTPIRSLNLSPDDMTKVAQVLVAQQQQRALAAAAAAQQNVAAQTAAAAAATNPLLQSNMLQNFAQNLLANGISGQQTPQNFLCVFCMKHFNSQASFTLHLSVVHFRNGVLNPLPQNVSSNPETSETDVNFNNPSILPSSLFGPPAALKTSQDSVNIHSDTATNSSCASSPQKVSPIQKLPSTTDTMSPILSDSDQLSGGSATPDTATVTASSGAASGQKTCEHCESNRVRVAELEQALAAKHAELKSTRELMRRISAIAGSLLESCTDFDKQWVSHSRKVYSQIQAVICNME